MANHKLFAIINDTPENLNKMANQNNSKRYIAQSLRFQLQNSQSIWVAEGKIFKDRPNRNHLPEVLFLPLARSAAHWLRPQQGYMPRSTPNTKTGGVLVLLVCFLIKNIFCWLGVGGEGKVGRALNGHFKNRKTNKTSLFFKQNKKTHLSVSFRISLIRNSGCLTKHQVG